MNKLENYCLQMYEDMNLLQETIKTQKHKFEEKKFHEFNHQNHSFFCLKNKQIEQVNWSES